MGGFCEWHGKMMEQIQVDGFPYFLLWSVLILQEHDLPSQNIAKARRRETGTSLSR